MVFGFFGLSRTKLWVRFGAKAGTVALIAIVSFAVVAQTKPLNDTGITFCGGATSGNSSPCLGTEPAGQDKNYGRDAAAIAGTLTKIGGSAGAVGRGPNGFDFTKITNDGSVLSAAATPLATIGGSGPKDWACTC